MGVLNKSPVGPWAVFSDVKPARHLDEQDSGFLQGSYPEMYDVNPKQAQRMFWNWLEFQPFPRSGVCMCVCV